LLQCSWCILIIFKHHYDNIFNGKRLINMGTSIRGFVNFVASAVPPICLLKGWCVGVFAMFMEYVKRAEI